MTTVGVKPNWPANLLVSANLTILLVSKDNNCCGDLNMFELWRRHWCFFFLKMLFVVLFLFVFYSWPVNFSVCFEGAVHMQEPVILDTLDNPVMFGQPLHVITMWLELPIFRIPQISISGTPKIIAYKCLRTTIHLYRRVLSCRVVPHGPHRFQTTQCSSTDAEVQLVRLVRRRLRLPPGPDRLCVEEEEEEEEWWEEELNVAVVHVVSCRPWTLSQSSYCGLPLLSPSAARPAVHCSFPSLLLFFVIYFYFPPLYLFYFVYLPISTVNACVCAISITFFFFFFWS